MKNALNVLSSGITVNKIAAYACLNANRDISRAEWKEKYRLARVEKVGNILISTFTAQVSGTMFYGYRNTRYIAGTVDHNANIGPKLHILDGNGRNITDNMRVTWYHKGIRTDIDLYNALLFHFIAYTVQDMDGNKKYWLYPSKLMSIERDIPQYTVFWK